MVHASASCHSISASGSVSGARVAEYVRNSSLSISRDKAHAAFLEAADVDGRVSERFEILTLSGRRG